MAIQRDDAIYIIVGHAIRRIRKQAKMSQQELAERLDIRRTSIVNIEYGRQRLPIHTLCAIAKLFDVPISMLFQEVPLTEEGQEQEEINVQLRLEIIRLREQIAKIRFIVA